MADSNEDFRCGQAGMPGTARYATSAPPMVARHHALSVSTPSVPGVDEAETGAGAETILARMTSAGIAEPRAREHLARSAVRIEGVVVEDPTTSAPKPQRWTIGAL